MDIVQGLYSAAFQVKNWITQAILPSVLSRDCWCHYGQYVWRHIQLRKGRKKDHAGDDPINPVGYLPGGIAGGLKRNQVPPLGVITGVI